MKVFPICFHKTNKPISGYALLTAYLRTSKIQTNFAACVQHLIIFVIMFRDLHDGRSNNKRQYLNRDVDKLAAISEKIINRYRT